MDFVNWPDYITTSSETVTYTVRFSEDMASSPQLNIVGISPLNYSQSFIDLCKYKQ